MLNEPSEVEASSLVTGSGVTEELKLEGFNFGADVAVFIIPLVNRRAAVKGLGAHDADLSGWRDFVAEGLIRTGLRVPRVHFGMADGWNNWQGSASVLREGLRKRAD